MKIFLNDEQIDFSLENEKNLGDILKAFEYELEKNNATITGINVNGMLLSANEIDDFGSKPITEIETLCLSCVAQDDIYRTLKDICGHFEKMIPSIENIPVELQSGHDNEARAVITDFADTFDLLCRTITLSSLFPDKFANLKVDETNIAPFLADFSPILRDLEQALQNGDTVLTGDLSEYEIAPRLNQLAELGHKL